MAPPLIDVDSLVQPVPGDEPAGDSVPFSVRQKLEEFRKEIDPNAFAEDDPLRPDAPKRAEWGAIIDLCTQTLKDTSKDLLVGARLTEALTKKHGFPGLRDALKLLHRLVQDAWDRVLPVIEDGDVEVRASSFNWLDDPDRGARFPNTIRQVPLVTLDGEGLGWQHWKNMQDGKGTLTGEQFDQAVQETPHAECQAAVDALNEGLKELQQLCEVLGAKMEGHAPGLLVVRQAMFDCQKLAMQIQERKGPDLGAEPEIPSDEPVSEEAQAAGAAPAKAAPGKGPRSRAEVYRQLTEAANLLQQMEPHSPIPYLVQRAVALGGMPFPQLMKALIREENILSELYRELGIKEAPPPSAPAE